MKRKKNKFIDPGYFMRPYEISTPGPRFQIRSWRKKRLFQKDFISAAERFGRSVEDFKALADQKSCPDLSAHWQGYSRQFICACQAPSGLSRRQCSAGRAKGVGPFISLTDFTAGRQKRLTSSSKCFASGMRCAISPPISHIPPAINANVAHARFSLSLNEGHQPMLSASASRQSPR